MYRLFTSWNNTNDPLTVGDVQGAADSTRSYQLLHTRNTVMNANLAVYKKLNGKEGIPRPVSNANFWFRTVHFVR